MMLVHFRGSTDTLTLRWELTINWLTVDSMVNLWLMFWLDSQSEDADVSTSSLRVWGCLCNVGLNSLFFSTVRWNLNDVQKHQKLNLMENLTTGLVFMIVVVNVFITAFGVHRPNRSNWPNNTFRYSFWLLLMFFFLSEKLQHSFSFSFQTEWFFFFSFVSILLQWTRVRSACFREPALLTSTTSYLTYKHTDLSGMAEKFPPLENNKRAENPFMGEWERNGSSDNGGGCWYVNSTTFVCVGGRTGKRRQQRSGPRDFAQSVSFVGWEWPQVLGQTLAAQPQPRKNAEWPLNSLQFLMATMTLGARCHHDPFLRQFQQGWSWRRRRRRVTVMTSRRKNEAKKEVR